MLATRLSRTGITLIEVVVVAGIIGILAAILIPAVQRHSRISSPCGVARITSNKWH